MKKIGSAFILTLALTQSPILASEQATELTSIRTAPLSYGSTESGEHPTQQRKCCTRTRLRICRDLTGAVILTGSAYFIIHWIHFRFHAHPHA